MKTYTDYEIIKAAVEYLSSHEIFVGHTGPIAFREIVRDITGWTIWTGGECPVSNDTNIEYMMGDSVVGKGLSTAPHIRWVHEGDHNDIIAYRIIEPDISELRGWCEVTEQDGDIAVMYAQEDGLSNYKNAATVTIKWEHVKTSGLKVRKLTPEDISDE